MAQVCWEPADTANQPAATPAGTVAAVGASLSMPSPEMPSCPEPPEPARTKTTSMERLKPHPTHRRAVPANPEQIVSGAKRSSWAAYRKQRACRSRAQMVVAGSEAAARAVGGEADLAAAAAVGWEGAVRVAGVAAAAREGWAWAVGTGAARGARVVAG